MKRLGSNPPAAGRKPAPQPNPPLTPAHFALIELLARIGMRAKLPPLKDRG